jgi:hypothetical protein
LEIASICFDWDSDWEFKYLEKTIKVKIRNYDFCNNVNDGTYSFAKGDMIYPDIKSLENSNPKRYELPKAVDVTLKYIKDRNVEVPVIHFVSIALDNIQALIIP